MKASHSNQRPGQRPGHYSSGLEYHHMFPIENDDIPLLDLLAEARERLTEELTKIGMKRVGGTSFNITETGVYVTTSVEPVDKRARLGLEEVVAKRVEVSDDAA